MVIFILFPTGLSILLRAEGVLAQVPASGLRSNRAQNETGLHHLHVFPAEDHRFTGHRLFRAAEKEQPDHLPSHIPSRGNGLWHVHLLQVPHRWVERSVKESLICDTHALLLETGSHATLLGLINSWVHVVMYTYYFLTAFKPELKQSFWWKKHITQVQLVSVEIIVLRPTIMIPVHSITDPILHPDLPLWTSAALQGLQVPGIRALLRTHTECLYVCAVLRLLH